MNTDNPSLNALTDKVLSAVFEVSNTLGPAFLEKVYRRALLRELSLRGIHAVPEASLSVSYKGQCLGEYFADLLVEDLLVVELNCVERLANEHMAQCLNYLRASGRTMCLLVNFQKPKVEWKRIVLTPSSSDSCARVPCTRPDPDPGLTACHRNRSSESECRPGRG